MQKVDVGPDGQEVIKPRGDRPQASTRLLDRFRASIFDWKGPKVHFGLILSGDKLINNKDYRDKLLRIEPEAIGGEMEGTGVYAAAYRNKVDWILVKAICDWADGNKDQEKEVRQKEHVLTYAGHSESVRDIAWSPDSSRLATASNDHTVHIWDSLSGAHIYTYGGHTKWATSLAWSPDGTRIASASNDMTVQIWQANHY